MAATIVFNTLSRKVYKPARGKLHPNIPGLTEYMALLWMCQVAIPSAEAAVVDFQEYHVDDEGLIKAILIDQECRPDSSGQVMQLGIGTMLYIDDFKIVDITQPVPTTYMESTVGQQPYLQSQLYLPGIDIPMLPDTVIFPRIEFANVFGGQDANGLITIHMFCLKAS